MWWAPASPAGQGGQDRDVRGAGGAPAGTSPERSRGLVCGLHSLSLFCGVKGPRRDDWSRSCRRASWPAFQEGAAAGRGGIATRCWTALPSRVFSGHQVPCYSKVHVRSAGPLGTCGGRGQNRPKYGPSLLYKSKAHLNSQLYVKFTHFRLRFPRSLLHYSHLTVISFGHRPQAG